MAVVGDAAILSDLAGNAAVGGSQSVYLVEKVRPTFELEVESDNVAVVRFSRR